jgi:hypothetical protein
MAPGWSSLLILLATAVAAVVIVWEVRQVLRRGEWDRDTTLAFVVTVLATSVIDVAVTYTDHWVKLTDAFGNAVTTIPGWAYQTQVVMYVLVAVGGAGVFLVRLSRPGATINVPALLLLLAVLVGHASAVLHGDVPLRPFELILLAVLVGTLAAPSGRSVHVGFGIFWACGAVAAGLAAVAQRDYSTFACAADKCGVLGFNFRGWLDNENAISMDLTLAMPFVYLCFGRRSGTLLSTYLLFLVLISGSRTGAVAAVATYVLLVLVRPDIRRPEFSRPRATLLYSTLAVTAAVGLVLPFVTQNPAAFTHRGYIWGLARESLSTPWAWILGSGSQAWEHVRQKGLIDFSAVYSVHNLWLQMLYSGGLVALALLIGAFVLLVVRAGRRYSLVVGSVLAPVFLLAMTEAPWPTGVVNWLVWAVPGALLCYPADRNAPQGQPPADAATDDGSMLSGAPGSGETS